MENDLFTKNRAILVRNSKETSNSKAIYITKAGFKKIVDALPYWYKPIAWTAFYTGMRQGEIRNLNRSQLDLDRRIIELSRSPSVWDMKLSMVSDRSFYKTVLMDQCVLVHG